MQLDSTRIAVRERTQVELMDLSLLVLKTYGGRLLLALFVGALPLAVINYLLIGWMASDEFYDFASFLPFRYVWNMSLLVFLEAPLGTVFVTQYLGLAVFEERPTWREVAANVGRSGLQLLVCLALFRGPVVAWVLYLAAWEEPDFTVPEFWVMLITGAAGLVRGIRPFLPEIVLLEHNPWFSRNPQVMTLSRRTTLLHTTINTALFPRWMMIAIMSVILTGAVAHGFLFLSGIFLHSWRWGPALVHVGVPLAMWLVALYVAVVRFLSYLDLRIRNEGWEVELRLRAEASRFQSRVT
ncbi:MAG: hypothetical protein U0935_15705 [Pirellulales bacterium]